MRGEMGRSLLVWAWLQKPNHWTESPLKEIKKAEPADLKEGFCQSRG